MESKQLVFPKKSKRMMDDVQRFAYECAGLTVGQVIGMVPPPQRVLDLQVTLGFERFEWMATRLMEHCDRRGISYDAVIA